MTEIAIPPLFEPFPKQIEFLEKALDAHTSLVLYGGAIRGGKTFAGLGALILLCKNVPQLALGGRA